MISHRNIVCRRFLRKRCRSDYALFEAIFWSVSRGGRLGKLDLSYTFTCTGISYHPELSKGKCAMLGADIRRSTQLFAMVLCTAEWLFCAQAEATRKAAEAADEAEFRAEQEAAHAAMIKKKPPFKKKK